MRSRGPLPDGRGSVQRAGEVLPKANMSPFSNWRSIVLAAACAAAFAAVLSGCSRREAEQPAKVAPPAAAEDELMRYRKERDQAFKSGPNSPLPEDERAKFTGLNYYPPNPALRYRVKLNRYPMPKRVRIGTNTGEIRIGLRYGYFEFEVDGKPCRLQVYRLTDDPAVGPASLFIPFKDSTSGSETYGGGRYIDLTENTSGVYDLDFNLAYNPSCAFSEGFSCPVPPVENWLPVPIRAGEKKFTVASNH